jgi:HEAT repeat protein
MEFCREVARFKDWSIRSSHSSAEWELEYPDWSRFESSFLAFINKVDCANWEPHEWDDVLYAVARDNECEKFIDIIAEDVSVLISLAQKAVRSDETQAKWQIAERLGRRAELEVAEPILLSFAGDADEYVRRRALYALSIFGSREVENLAVLAWDSGLLYQRIGALHALSNIGSSQLEHFLKLAEQDGRKHLIANASVLRSR